MKDDWHSLADTPPDARVEVIDAEGKTAFAYPTWYPFKTVANPNKVGRWSSDIVPCEPYWDGGWLIECVGFTLVDIGQIVGWRPAPQRMNPFDIDRAWKDGFDLKVVDGGFTVVGPEKEYGTYPNREEAIENLVADHESWLESVAIREMIESDPELKAQMDEICSGKTRFKARKQ